MAARCGWRPLTVVTAILVALALSACASEVESSPETSTDPLEFRRLPGAEALPARLPPPEARPGGDRRAEFQRAEAPQRCGDGCAQDPACAWGCFFEAEERVPEARRSAEADCLFCGRETGFLDSPVLMAAVDGKALTLTWSPVDEADDYVVHGVRWDTEADETAPLRSHAWRTEDTRLSLEPEPGTWTFYVIAYRGQPKSRSLRSNIVDLDL